MSVGSSVLVAQGVNEIARANDVQQVTADGGVEQVFHRIELMIEVTEEFIEAMDGQQKLVLVTKMILAKLAGSIPCALSAVAMVRASAGIPDVPRPPGRLSSCRCGWAIHP